jgi:hypothetical protein
MKNLPDVETLHKLFDYKDGNLIWKIQPSKIVKAGSVAGYKNQYGYIVVRIKRSPYQAHRLIWAWHNRTIPSCLDHINGDRCDNRIENLRLATYMENSHNRKIARHNTSGFKGICASKNKSKWTASIMLNGKRTHLGTFEDKNEAIKAYEKASIYLHKDFRKQI